MSPLCRQALKHCPLLAHCGQQLARSLWPSSWLAHNKQVEESEGEDIRSDLSSVLSLLESFPRCGARASIWSKNKMQGAHVRAFLKSADTAFSELPIAALINSVLCAHMKFACLQNSFAAPIASAVFPDPGGPYSSKPLGGVSPSASQTPWAPRAASIPSLSLCFSFSRPTSSLQPCKYQEMNKL